LKRKGSELSGPVLCLMFLSHVVTYNEVSTVEVKLLIWYFMLLLRGLVVL
jgi:hypothetical protein